MPSINGGTAPQMTPSSDEKIDKKMNDQEPTFAWQGSYELGEVLGSGAWSNVYAASNSAGMIETPSGVKLKKGSLLAIKSPSSKMALSILKNEARILTYLMQKSNASDHIIEFYGENIETNALVFAQAEASLMDIIKTSLSNPSPTLQNTDPIMTLPVWLSSTRQLISALSWLHTHHVVHADLKPHNILSNPDGTLRIADFSSSFYLPPSGTYEPRPTDAITARYASPELLASYSVSSLSSTLPRHPTFASDIWALACVLLVAATGHEPYAFAGHEIRRLAMARDGGVVDSYHGADDWRVVMRVKRGGLVEKIVAPALIKNLGKRVDCEAWMGVVDEVTAAL